MTRHRQHPCRPGIFRPLLHGADTNRWWIALRGEWTEHCGLTGQIIVLARCGAACWPGGDTDNPILRWCPACFPGKQDLLDQRNRDTPANRFVGLGPDAYVGAVPDLADLRCPPLEPAASPAGATRGEAGGTGRRVGWFTPSSHPPTPVNAAR